MKKIYLFCCTISSLSISAWIFALKKGWTINLVLQRINIKWKLPLEQSVDLIISGVLYFLVLLFFAWLTTLFFKSLDEDSIDKNHIVSIRPSGSELMLAYFGLFFFALSTNSGIVFLLAFLILTCAIFFSSRSLFNPLYIFLGYKFFNLRISKHDFLFISKKGFKEGDDIESFNVKTINDYTFVDIQDLS